MMKPLALAALVLLAFSCASPLGPPNPGTSAQTPLAPGQAKLVLKTLAGRALLSDAGFLTLALRSQSGGETRYASAAKAPDDTYSILLDNVTAGDWDLSARLYPGSEDTTLLFYANKSLYIAAGTTSSVDLKVYEPGSIGGLTVTEAGLPSVLEVRNFHTGDLWIGPRTLPMGLPVRLAATLLDNASNETADQRVEWSSTNPSVATVSASGRLSPQNVGSASVQATSVVDRRVTVSFAVTVEASVVGYWKAADGTVVKVLPNPQAGSAFRITVVRANPAAYETGPLATQGGDSYAILLNRQLVAGQIVSGPGYEGSLQDNQNGTLSITGANFSGTVVFDRVVDPKPVTSMLVDVSNPADLQATVVPGDATIQAILWSSGTPATATIGALSGVVTTLTPGPVSFVAQSLEDPTVHRQIWSTTAQTTLPLVTVTGPSTVGASDPLATFTLQSNLAGPTQTQWLVDGQIVETRTDGSVAPLALNTANLGAGSHLVMVKITAGGQVYTSSSLAFTVRQLPRVQVASMNHTLHLKADGTLWGWGENTDGQLGIGNGIDQIEPVLIDSNVVQVAAGEAHSLYLKRDGTLWFAGDYFNGEAGIGVAESGTNVPIQVMTGGILSIAAGNNQSWVLKTDGTLWGTGSNGYGALGAGDLVDRATFTQVATNVASVYASPGDTTFIVKTDGSLLSAGFNDRGQLGDGSTQTRNFFFPVLFNVSTVANTGSIVSVAAGVTHTVLVTSTGQVWAAGANSLGETGLGVYGTYYGFLYAGTVTGATKAVVGQDFSALLTSDGTVWATGSNTAGQFGDGSLLGSRNTFAAVNLLRPQSVKDLVARPEGQYTILTDDTLWGNGLNNATTSWLGDGTSILQSAPVPINAGPAREKLFASQYRTFIIKPDGTLWAAGDNTNGELGDGTTTTRQTFVNVMPTERFVSVAPGPDHTLFLKTNGTVWVVGSDSDEQQGNGLGVVANPAPEQLMTNAKAIAAGNKFSLVLTRDGFVYGFGLNSGGQMGTDFTATPSFVVPLGLTNGDHAVAIGAGSDYGLILKADGTLLSAGVNGNNGHGQAGAFAVERQEYTEVLDSVLAISAGWQHSMVLKADHTLWAAGWNAAGQLGRGDTLDAASGYVQVATRVAAVSTGFQNTLILKLDGTLWRTGLAYSTDLSPPSTPVFVDEATTMAAGGYDNFFGKPDGTLWWFGSDEGSANGIAGGQTPTATPERVW